LFVEKALVFEDSPDDNDIEIDDGGDADESADDEGEGRLAGSAVDDDELEPLEEDAGKSLWEDEDGSQHNDRKRSADSMSHADELPIHEHPVAHALLKQIVQFEASANDADKSFWETPENFNVFTSTLIKFLGEDKVRLATWLSCNRSCFALAEMLKVKSEEANILALIGPIKKLQKSSESLAGGKVLIDMMQSRTLPVSSLDSNERKSSGPVKKSKKK